MSDSPIPNLESPSPVSRRQALAALGVGAALLGSNALTGSLAYRAGDRADDAATEARLAEVSAELERVTVARDQALADLKSASFDVVKLRGLLKLYETLEAIPIDAVIGAGIKAVAVPFAAVQAAASGLRTGIRVVEAALSRFEAAVPGLATALDAAENNLRWIVDDRLQGLRRVLDAAAERAEPLAEALGAFFNGLIERIPGSVGERIRDVVARIRELLGDLDTRLQPVRDGLVAPLRRDWFTPDQSGVQSSLFTPLQQTVLTPLDNLLTNISDLSGRWQADLVAPVEQTLQERAAVRQQIHGYRAQHEMGDTLAG